MGPQLMTMTPQLFVLPKDALPLNETYDVAKVNQGTIVNGFRDTVIRVIAQDPVLLDLVTSNGSIAYMGMETDFKSGSALQGQCRLDFAFTYPYDPTEPLPA